MNEVAPRRLPIHLAVRRSFLFAWESRAVFARPYAIYAAVTILAELLLLAVAGHRSKLADYSLMGAEELFALSFSVGIHRFVLLGEAAPGLAFFRVDRHFVQYVLVAAVLLILGILAAMPGLMVMGVPGDDAELAARGPAAMIATVITIVAAIVISRMMLVLPSTAIGDDTRTRAVWTATMGNGLRIFATMMLTVLPFLVIEGLLTQLVPLPPAGAAESGAVISGVSDPGAVTFAEFVVTAILGLIAPAQTIVCSIMLSLCYDALVRGGVPGASRTR
jgi:hypothetical protein